ncbi:hypothetical protein PICSAR222_04251 [Mycobacterium avium subsp. paratuberculosis]|nr:hypothetical protein PICSAR222_04251 [Mycobacterium avium subsp. paratuberculosis]
MGAALAHEAGTDNPPIDAALPTDPPIEPSEPRPAPGTAAGRTASAALATPSPADLAAGIMPWAMPWMSLNEVVNSRVGEINRMNASKGVLASRVCDPVSPSSRSPSGPPMTSPSPSGFRLIPPSENPGLAGGGLLVPAASVDMGCGAAPSPWALSPAPVPAACAVAAA